MTMSRPVHPLLLSSPAMGQGEARRVVPESKKRDCARNEIVRQTRNSGKAAVSDLLDLDDLPRLGHLPIVLTEGARHRLREELGVRPTAGLFGCWAE